MRNLAIFTVCMLCSIVSLHAQQKFNVQNGTKTKFYDDLETAISKAVSGDTIYLPGGDIWVQKDLIIDKKLAIIGAGYDADSIGGLQISNIRGYTPITINFRNGSNGSLLTGCCVSGNIRFGHKDELNVPFQDIQNVVIWRNRIYGSILLGVQLPQNYNIKNIVVKENTIEGGISGFNGATDCIISNNFFPLYIYPSTISRYGIGNFKKSHINNNVVCSISYSDSCVIENNYICYPSASISSSNILELTNCVFNNNAFLGDVSFTSYNNKGENNLVNQAIGNTFQASQLYLVYSIKDAKIKSTSPCKNAGTDGTDIGIYGGSTPYRSIPFNPHIDKAIIDHQMDKEGELKVDIQVSAQTNLVAYEYWVNDNYNQKYTITTPPQQTFILKDSIYCSLADKVINTISFRFKDDVGLWSSTLSTDFYRLVTISANFTYMKSVLPNETPIIEDEYPNYADVGFTVYNITKKQDVTDISYQYPNIVLNQPINVGDSISITAISHSTSNGFEPVTKKIVIGNENNILTTFNIVQHGFILSNYLNSENNSNVGIVYDSNGHRVAQYDYINKTLTTGELPDGIYQLVSMANSLFFNTIQNLSSFGLTEILKQNIDYVLQTLDVKSGIITETLVETIPKLDENKVYYTTDNALFSVNKTSIAIGNYVTLRSEIDFKEEYKTKVSNVKLIVDIPGFCPFVNNSVMRGNSVFNGYTLQNNQLTIPLTNYSDVVKFCIIPSQEGNYAPNGFVEFTLDGKTIRQPIGTANFMAEGLNIVVPRLTTQNTIPIRGVATPLSLIKIYDNEELIGQTTALANGNWNIQCKLYEPYPFSIHNIYAEITTSQGLVLETVVEHVIHNISAIQVSKVTMYNTAHPSGSLELKEYVTEFDFLNPPEKGGVYWYWPNYPDFTFKIEFTNNDSTLVHNVLLNVLTSNGSIVSLPTVYDGTKQIWVATGDFYSNNLPVNVTVGYNTTEMCVECTNNPSNTNYVLKTSNISNELSTDNRYLPDFNPKDRNCNGASGKDIVNSIIVHSTFNNTYPNPPWNSFIDPFDIEEIVKIYKETGLYPHYIIGRDGVIYKLADVSKRAPHAGGAKGKPSKILCNTPCSEKVNDISVGIELVVLKDCAPGGIIRKGNVIVNDPVNDYHPTVAQITALTNLINEIRGGCPIKNLLSHQDVDGTRKTDPWGMNMNEYRNNMGWDKPFGCVPPPNYTCPVPASFVLDPSGFVYEAVPSNRLQGVTVGVYHKKQEEDMYGTITEKIVLWNAADYGQTNPQITNEYGEYAWDVPQDLWQVKYEKAGYETVYSNWLPVPPPQLDINIAMVQAVPPRVKKTQGYESGIEITFDKFMQPATMTTDFISVTRNGANVAGIINLLDAEINPANSSERFVSKVKFVPEDPFLTTDAVILTVKHTVRSYTGNEMDNDFVQQIAIQHEVNSLTATPTLNLALQEKGSIEVTATPAGASAGKKITARSVSSALATVTDNAVLDATGKAKLQVSAELPGSTQIIVTLDGTDINAIATVNIAMPAIVERVKIPIASIPSGSTVDKNATVTLSSNTAGATIYYTLNGSAPSAATGLKYTQPIVLTEDVTIKAVAVKEGMSDSEVAVFEYTVKSGNVITEVKGKPQEWMIVSPIPVRVGKSCKISFNLPEGNLKDYDIAVYSILGQRVYENRRLSPVIEIYGLHQGQYIVRMSNKNNGNHQTQKILVVN